MVLLTIIPWSLELNKLLAWYGDMKISVKQGDVSKDMALLAWIKTIEYLQSPHKCVCQTLPCKKK